MNHNYPVPQSSFNVPRNTFNGLPTYVSVIVQLVENSKRCLIRASALSIVFFRFQAYSSRQQRLVGDNFCSCGLWKSLNDHGSSQKLTFWRLYFTRTWVIHWNLIVVLSSYPHHHPLDNFLCMVANLAGVFDSHLHSTALATWRRGIYGSLPYAITNAKQWR